MVEGHPMASIELEKPAVPPFAYPAAKPVAAGKVEAVAGLHDTDILRYIPVPRSAVMDALAALDYRAAYDRKTIGDALHYLGRLHQQDSALKLDELMDDYHLFNPDNDIEFAVTTSAQEKELRRKTFLEGVGQLVFRANFEPIRREELERVLSQTSPYGVEVDVDIDEFDPLLPFYRGVRGKARSKRDWRWGYLRARHFHVPSYERLFLALTLKPAEQRIAEIMRKERLSRKSAERKFRKLRRAMPEWVSSEHVYLKMFKDIPQIDIDMLLPNNGVKFRQFDRLMLWLSGGGTTVYALAVTILKLALAVAISPIVMFLALFGFGGTAFRQIMSVINTRTRYMAELVQKLYFHNISSNQGTLTLLIDEAEEEDIKEDALLYAFLLKQLPQTLDLERAKDEIEVFLHDKFTVKVNFDHEEAFGRLAGRGLAGAGHDGGIWTLPPDAAVQHLRQRWMEALDVRAGSTPALDATLSADAR
jgi:Protein of unknown function (DUF3754)